MTGPKRPGPVTMPLLPRETLDDLGHWDTEVFLATSGFWIAACSCGFVSKRNALEREAIRSAVWHLQGVRAQVVRNARRAGVTVSEMLSVMSERTKPPVAPDRTLPTPADGREFPHLRKRPA